MEATSISETAVNVYRLHGAVTQKTNQALLILLEMVRGAKINRS
jgi:hypothetical protein